LDKENRNRGFPHGADHSGPETGGTPAHGASGEVNCCTEPQLLLRVGFKGEHCLNATVGAAGHGDSMRWNVRPRGEISESRQLIFEMCLVQRDGSPTPWARRDSTMESWGDLPCPRRWGTKNTYPRLEKNSPSAGFQLGFCSLPWL